MQDCTNDDYLLEPLKKAVRYADRDTPRSVIEFAAKLSGFSILLHARTQMVQ